MGGETGLVLGGVSKATQAMAGIALLLYAGVVGASPKSLVDLTDPPSVPRAGSARQGAQPVKAELLADTNAVQPGKTFTVGVLFRMRPGWHIYWKNAGDAGIPTAVELIVPKGFSLGKLRWPVPVTFKQPGNITSYGYSESVLLSAEVQAPRKLPTGPAVVIGADVSWLACEKECLPGQADLKIKLASAASASPANAGLFATWRGRLPTDAGSPGSPTDAGIAGKIPAGAASGRFSVVLAWRHAAANVKWLPVPPEGLSIEKATCKTQGRKTRIEFTTSILRGLRLSNDSLETLVLYTDSKGRRRGVALAVPLRSRPCRGAVDKRRSTGKAPSLEVDH